MPPVMLTGDLGTRGGTVLNVVARSVGFDGTMIVTFDYNFQPMVEAKYRTFHNVHIDTIEFIFVATSIDQEADGLRLPNDAIVVAAGATQLPVDRPCDVFSGHGSIVLPVRYFLEKAHRTWTVILRSRGCRDENGSVGVSRVLSAEFRPVRVSLHSVLGHEAIEAILDGTAGDAHER